MQRIIVRADSSYDIGSGHVKRCINIAKEFKERGWQVHFICCSLDGDFSHLIEEEGFHLHSFIQEYPEEDKVPRPKHWSGWNLKPYEIEFWLQRKNRIHERLKYKKKENDYWERFLLNP